MQCVVKHLVDASMQPEKKNAPEKQQEPTETTVRNRKVGTPPKEQTEAGDGDLEVVEDSQERPPLSVMTDITNTTCRNAVPSSKQDVIFISSSSNASDSDCQSDCRSRKVARLLEAAGTCPATSPPQVKRVQRRDVRRL